MADGSRSIDAQEGCDPTALAAVYRAHARYVWRVLRHCGVPDPDLDDAVQETFLVVFRRLPDFAARASLRTWIYAIAVRVAATRRRSQRREAARREHAGLDMHGTGAADPEAELSKAEAAELVDRLLDELDGPKRTVFVLAELEGVRVPEISRILGVNPRTVHSRLRLARESFGSAFRRMQAHEEGNRRVARLRPRPLLERAANDRPSVARRKAAMAALAVRIEQGAMPVLAGWQGLALGGWAGGWGLPAAVLGTLGVVAAAVVVPLGTVEPSLGPPPSEVGDHSQGVRATEESRAPHVPARASTAEVPAVRADATIDGSLVPAARSSTTTSNGDDRNVRTDATIERPHSTSVRANSMIGQNHVHDARPTTASDTLASHDTRADAMTDVPADDAAMSTLAAETRLLEQARDALRRGDARAALSALDAHVAEFPAGLLLDEARSTRLRALCAAGRSDEASALAERLATGQQGTRWHDVVAASCR